jgi:hypothetical protein
MSNANIYRFANIIGIKYYIIVSSFNICVFFCFTFQGVLGQNPKYKEGNVKG